MAANTAVLARDLTLRFMRVESSAARRHSACSLETGEEGILAKRSSGRRELIDTGRNKMYGRRDERGQFRDMDDVTRSASTDQRREASRKAPRGHGDRGDR
jgi:hypothetical protein